MSDALELSLPDVTNPDDVLSFTQNILSGFVNDKDTPLKDRITAATALARTALTQKRLNQDSTTATIQLEIARGVLQAFATQMPSVHQDYIDAPVTSGRALGFTVTLPDIQILPGETSVTQEEFTYAEIMGEHTE
jgi:hypothetical protein